MLYHIFDIIYNNYTYLKYIHFEKKKNDRKKD